MNTQFKIESNVPIIITEKGIRKLSPLECFMFQGFPKEFKLPNIADTHLYKQAGNSVVVPVIKRLAEKIIIAMKQQVVIKLISISKLLKYKINKFLTEVNSNQKQTFSSNCATHTQLHWIPRQTLGKDNLLSQLKYFKLN